MGAPALSLPDSLRQIKQRSRSVCHIMPDAAGMVLVVLMGSTLLCEMGGTTRPNIDNLRVVATLPHSPFHAPDA